MNDSLSQRVFGHLLGALLLGLAAAAPAQTVVGGGAAVTKKQFGGTAKTLPSPWSYSVVGNGNGKAALMSNDATLYGLRDENDSQTPVWPAPQPAHF